jgi:hypothetical protein
MAKTALIPTSPFKEILRKTDNRNGIYIVRNTGKHSNVYDRYGLLGKN